jgi:phosphoglucosamine mutase
MNKKQQYFGTDGIRGAVGKFPITPDFALKLGWAAGQVLGNGQSGKILIGKDTRISGYMFESALESGLSAAGMNVYLLGPMPTPAIAYLTRTFQAKAGIVISASHNAFQDNGFKFFSSKGTKLSDSVEFAIEEKLSEPLEVVPSRQLGKVERISDAAGRYIEFCKSTIPYDVHLKGLKIVVDCANGATYRVAPSVFSELGAEVQAIAAKPNGLNINVDCGSTHPQALQKAVLKYQADLGIALDGDGDRVLMVDSQGELVDGDELVFIIATARKQAKKLRGAVVGTLMSNLGLEKALKNQGIPFLRADVGDRYVLEMLQQNDGIIGGESSGHILCLDRATAGDGIISALQVLATMVKTQSSLYELKKGMTKYPQRMINILVKEKQAVMSHLTVHQAVENAEKMLENQGRILLRPSGTESLIRVMVEGVDEKQVESAVQELAATVQKISNAL